MTASGPVEVWRGGVNTWEIDMMGHLNVRFYVARAMEGLVGAAAALGLAGAFKARAAATLIVREHHIRFLREARPGAGLHMTVGVVSIDETEAVLLQTLVHSSTGEAAATFLTRVVHAVPADGRPFPWPERAHEAAERLKVEVPSEAGPRGISGEPFVSKAAMARADELGMACSGRGAILPQDCDVFGRMGAEGFLGRISDGMGGFMAPMRDAMNAALEGRRIGGAAIEYRLVYLAWPRAGDGVELRSGWSGADSKVQRHNHWLLDPVTGQAWGTSEAASVSLDLDARKLATAPSEVLAEMQTWLTPGMSL